MSVSVRARVRVNENENVVFSENDGVSVCDRV